MRALLALGPLALFLAASPAAAAPTWLAPQTIAAPGQEIQSPQVATDPQGNAIAVWERRSDDGRRVEAAFRPAGGAFAAPQPISPEGFDSTEPRIVADAQGNAIAVWQKAELVGSRVQAAFRPAGGAFGEPRFVSAPGQDAEMIQIAADPQGNAVAVWQSYDGAQRRVEAAFRPAGGEFGEPKPLSPDDRSALEPHVAVDSQGNAIAVWRVSDGPQYRIETAFRPAGGEFGEGRPISKEGKTADDPQVATDAQGNAIAVWTIQEGPFLIEAAFRPAGGEFGAAQPISALPHSSFEPRIATDPLGNAVAVWRGYDGSNKRIAAAFRPAGGGFFGSPQTLSGAGRDGVQPQLATDPQGNAIAVWKSEDGANLRIEAAFRPAGGAFGAPQPISAAGQDASEAQVATDAQGNAIAVWRRFDGSSWLAEAAGFDAAGPQLRSLSIPASAEAGVPVAFSVAPFDVWSQVATSWSFGDGASVPGDAVSHAFAKPGAYQVTVTSTDAVGNSSSATGTVTVEDTRRPAISHLRVTPNAVRAAAPRRRARRSATRKRKRSKPRPARIRFRLSERARVVFTAKRRVRRRCGKRRCVRLVKVRGRLGAAGKKGANAVPFSGRLGGRPLPAGRYVLTATATDAAGNRSRRATASFRVTR